MSLKLRIALIIGLIVCVPGMCLMINKLAETSPDEVRESINMRVNSERQLEQPKSPSSSSRHLLNIIDEPSTTASETTTDTTATGAPSRPALMPNFPTNPFILLDNKSVRTTLHGLIACYIFWMLAIICDEYFIPSIETLCQKMNLSGDVASATFVSMATSCPELLINCISTFVNGGDIGVGTIVGSAAFNMLAIPALCGFFTCASIQLDWWSMSRDCSFYFVAVIALIAVIYDSQIMWYEATFLVICYAVYLIAMSKNDKMSEKAKCLAHVIRRKLYRQRYRDVTEISPLFTRQHSRASAFDYKACEPQPEQQQQQEKSEKIELSEAQMRLDNDENDPPDLDDSPDINPWKNFHSKRPIINWLRLPIDLLAACTIPSPRHKDLYILTFIICVIWIGICSYLIVYVTTDVDSVMGMTFLALGTSIPEAMSSIILTSHGFGPLSVSNSIQSNIFDICLCLGLPWLFRSLIDPTAVSDQPIWMFKLKTTDANFSTISLTMTLLALYIPFFANKFVLDKKIGFCCTIFYLLFLIFASFVDFHVLNLTRISDS